MNNPVSSIPTFCVFTRTAFREWHPTPSMSKTSTRSPVVLVLLLLAWLIPAAATHAATNSPPPIPTTPAKEMKHPPSVPLWPNGAPGSEARKNEPEKVDWRQEPDIVFPVTSNIHDPSITPYLPSKGRATGCAVIIAPGGGGCDSANPDMLLAHSPSSGWGSARMQRTA